MKDWIAGGCLVVVAVIITDTASSAPSPLLKYETEMAPYYEIEAQAEMARSCGLRSEQWYEVILTGFSIAQNKTIGKYDLSSQTAAIDAYGAKIGREIMSRFSCETLLNSPTMDRLDAIENKLTGGYH